MIIMWVMLNKSFHFSHDPPPRSDQTTIDVRKNVVIGNDGAYSLIRREMSKQPW